jgi:uncharacterized protein YkwD
MTAPARGLSIAALLALITFALIAAEPGNAKAKAHNDCTAADLSLDRNEQQLLNLINQYRAQSGRGPLTASVNLSRSASWMALDMAAHDYLDHADTLGRAFAARIDECDVQYGTAGENVAAGYETARAVFDAWKASSQHNATMLNPAFRQAGIARAYNARSSYGYYWVTDFSSVDDGTRAPRGSAFGTPTRTPTRTATPLRSQAKVVATPTRPASPGSSSLSGSCETWLSLEGGMSVLADKVSTLEAWWKLPDGSYAGVPQQAMPAAPRPSGRDSCRLPVTSFTNPPGLAGDGTCEIWLRQGSGAYTLVGSGGVLEAWWLPPGGGYGPSPRQSRAASPYPSSQSQCRIP